MQIVFYVAGEREYKRYGPCSIRTGIEPVAKPTVSDVCIGTCGSCQYSGAARALHSGGNGCQLLATFDSDVRQLVEAWASISAHAKQSIVALSQLK